MKRLALLLVCLAMLPLWGCQTLLDGAARVRAERATRVEVQNLRLVVESAAQARLGDSLVLIARGGDGNILPVLCTAYNAARCASLDAGAALVLNKALFVGCNFAYDGVTYTRCVEPGPGDVRGGM